MGRLLLAVFVGLAACVSQEVPAPVRPIPVKTLERFRVLAGTRPIGFLELKDVGGTRYVRVENANGGWVGDIFSYWRFFKNEPFQERPREIGLYSKQEGLQLLFETSERLRVVPLGARGEPAEAAAGKRLHQALVVEASK